MSVKDVAALERTLSPTLRIYDESGQLVASDIASLAATVSLLVPATGFHTIVVQDSRADDVGNYTLDFVYLGAAPPTRTRGIVLEPNDWYLLGVPGDAGGTMGESFDDVLDLADYADADAAQGWILYAYETATAISPTGSYRQLDLSEPVFQGTGFWFLHLGPTALRLNLPVSAADAAGTTGGGCASGTTCITTPLSTAPQGDWTIGAVPTTLSPGVDAFRFVTDAMTPVCIDGCTLEQAAMTGYARPSGVWVYEQSTRNYRLLSSIDSVAPWTGFWIFATAAGAQGSPDLRSPVQ